MPIQANHNQLDVYNTIAYFAISITLSTYSIIFTYTITFTYSTIYH